jgi:hypothetical protein
MLYDVSDRDGILSAEAKIRRPERQSATASERLRSEGYQVIGYEPGDLRVQRYRRDLHRDLWEAFISTTANGNLFQARRFLEYHRVDRFEDHSLLFWRGEKLIAVAAGEAVGDEWSSHRFTSEAGLAALPDLSAAEALDLVHTLLSYASRRNWKKLSMRYVPDALAEASFTTLVWALSVSGFSEHSRELAWCMLPRFASEDELIKAYHESARRGIAKALSAKLRAYETNDWANFWRLLTANLKGRFNVVPTHSLVEIECLRELCRGEVRLHGVHDERDRMIAGAVIFDVSRSASHCFYFAQDYDFQRARPMTFLMHHINTEYVVNRKRKLDYGVITAHGGEELNLGLSRFKSHFAAVPVIRRRYTWEKNR